MPLQIDRSLRLEPGRYFPPSGQKSGIALHHTVGGSAASSVDWWRRSGKMIGTAYMIERDGTIHEVFEPTAWAWQFGLDWGDAAKAAFERRFIGIELASEGGLIASDGCYYCFDRISPKTRKAQAEVFDFGLEYRGYRYFDRYEPAQIDSLVALVDHLCTQFGIERKVPDRPIDFHGRSLSQFRGVIGHAMVRRDKSDPMPDVALWQRLIRDCGLQVESGAGDPSSAGSSSPGSSSPGSPGSSASSSVDLDALFEDNVQQINRMDVASGSMIKGVLLELERNGRNTYIRLRDAVPVGHVVKYDFVRGTRELVPRVAKALGLKSVTADTLEVL